MRFGEKGKVAAPTAALQSRAEAWRNDLVAAATAAAAASAASAGGAGGFCRAAGDCRAEDGELDRGFFAGTLGAGDFLLAIDDDFFELRVAIIADVFVDGHARFLFCR
jgi:hypothetical protein